MFKHEVILDSFLGAPEVVKQFHTKSAANKYLSENVQADAFTEMRVRSVTRVKSKIPQRLKRESLRR